MFIFYVKSQATFIGAYVFVLLKELYSKPSSNPIFYEQTVREERCITLLILKAWVRSLWRNRQYLPIRCNEHKTLPTV